MSRLLLLIAPAIHVADDTMFVGKRESAVKAGRLSLAFVSWV